MSWNKISVIISVVLLLSGLFFTLTGKRDIPVISAFRQISPTPTTLPLLKYSIDNLRNRIFEGSEILIGKNLKQEETFSSYIFFFTVDGKKVSGLMNVPNKKGSYPLIIQYRGYVPREIYTIGEGTRHSGEVFAAKGFITLAPDFLGYGESDMPSVLPLEERFQTYTTAMELLHSKDSLNNAFLENRISARYNGKTGIWGHSNGGHIAITVLEAEEAKGNTYPAVLWAPVSKPFPYSVLYYTDEAEDYGKAMRKILADFEKDYDADKFSLTNYLHYLKGPIQLHQGTADEPIPVSWTNALYASLKKNGAEVEYFTYPGDDHNFAKGSWNTVVARNIEFFSKNLR